MTKQQFIDFTLGENDRLLGDLYRAIKERDEARRVARDLWRSDEGSGSLWIHEEVSEGYLEWLTEDGPEDVAAREAQQVADHQMMKRVFGS